MGLYGPTFSKLEKSVWGRSNMSPEATKGEVSILFLTLSTVRSSLKGR